MALTDTQVKGALAYLENGPIPEHQWIARVPHWIRIALEADNIVEWLPTREYKMTPAGYKALEEARTP